MRSVTTAVLFSLMLTSCSSRGPSQTDGYGALAAAIVLGAGLAVYASSR
jgi:hypothetical protein